MNAHALAVLEFDAVLEAVAAGCGSELGRASLLARRPGTELEAIRGELVRVWETLALRQARPDQSPPMPPEASGALRVLEREGGVLDAAQAALLLVLLRRGADLRHLMPAEGRFPSLEPLRDALLEAPAETALLDRIVDEHGEIKEGASPELRRIRRALHGARNRIVQRLEALIQALPERVRVPDASVSVREGRYVIQIRREGKSEVGGVIHGESATGATLFVEPPIALRLMAEVSALERDEDREIQRILREATERVRPRHAELVRSFEALIEMDTLWARAGAAARWGGTLPELMDPADEARRGISIVEARHPLLLEARSPEAPVVPFSLTLGPEERALVISGPNTGGKTVFLKAMGLLPLLAQTGIIPPVGPGTRLPLLDNVFADIGDEQSISQSLSTFSAHLVNAREILQQAGPGTLVLMDEMGTGTDPAEGAALGRAILETLVERGARALVTSHLSPMKRLDEAGSGIVNASLLFDPAKIRPTYQLQKGRPGRSYGMAIARRLGIPPEVLDRAEAYVSTEEREMENLLETLEGKEQALSRALADAASARDEATRMKAALDLRQRALDERERAAETLARDEARRRLLEARSEVEEAIRELRATDEAQREEAARAARRRIEVAAEAQRSGSPYAPPASSSNRTKGKGGRGAAPSPRGAHPLGASAIVEGDRVRIRGSGARGVVRLRREDRLVVEVGGLRLQLREGEVERIEGGQAQGEGGATSRATASGGRAPRPRDAEGGGGTITIPEHLPRFEVQLLGLRVDEVELALGRAIDDAVIGSLPELRIVHGKGTGAVRARVQELLRSDPRVESFRGGVHGEGGGGVTVAVLR